MRRIACFLLVLAMTAGCATMSEEDCQYTDWRALGQADGRNGETVGRFQRYNQACANYGITPNFSRWNEGRKLALQQFCTPMGVYSAGLRRRGNPSECGANTNLFRIHQAASEFARLRSTSQTARQNYDSLLSSFEWDRRNIRDMRRRLAREDLGKDERRRAERSLQNSIDDLDRFPFRLRDAEFRLRQLDGELNRAQYELMQLELEFNLGSASGPLTRRRF